MIEKISIDQAKIIAGKVNELIQSSYINKDTFTIDDVVKLGLSIGQAKRVMRGFVKAKIVYLLDGKYMAHPETLVKIRKEIIERTTI
jgi:hypothetical protein